MTQQAAFSATSGEDLDAITLIDAIHKIRNLPAVDRDLNLYANLIRQLCKARNAILVSTSPQIVVLGRAVGNTKWLPGTEFFADDNLAQRALQNGFAYASTRDDSGAEFLAVLIRVQGYESAFIALDLPLYDRPRLNEVVMRALLAADLSKTGSQGPATDLALLNMLDLSAQIMSQEKFGSAVLALVNGVVAKFSLDFATLCWIVNGQAQVIAISHLDRFDKDSDMVRHIAAAGEEALEFNQELWWPADSDSRLDKLSDTAKLAAAQDFSQYCSLPIHDSHGLVSAVLLVASKSEIIASESINQLQIGLDLIEPRLADLYRAQLGAPAKFRNWLKAALIKALGPQNIWGKFAVLCTLLVLIISLIFSWPYRIEATSELATDSTRIISAQFDGRVDEVLATAGDLVEANAPLAMLDTKELIQQQLEVRNEAKKLDTELGKARAAGNLADSEIYQARVDEANAKLQRVDYSLNQATNLAPFKGVIVEGERKDLLGAPVKKGDKLFKISMTENLYANLLIPEKEIRGVSVGAPGEMELLSRPDQRIKFKIISIIPITQVKGQDGNHFQARAQIEQSAEDWWRPGMTGVAKIEAGKRQIFWIWTHKIVDFFRMKFWF